MLRHSTLRRCSQRAAGYGPFSGEAKARQRRQAQQEAGPTQTSSAEVSPDMMQHMQIETNLNLRLSLAALPHPSTMGEEVRYQSPEWRQNIAKLYRTILRLHNKPVAVSLAVSRSRTGGPSAAVAQATAVHAAEADANTTTPTDMTDYMLRYLLTPEQRVFGNRFVHEEFGRHMDADAITAAIFYDGWYQYVLQLASGVTARELTEDERRLLNPEQKETLNELRGSLFSMRAENEPGFMM